jgi:hypothetical protein
LAFRDIFAFNISAVFDISRCWFSLFIIFDSFSCFRHYCRWHYLAFIFAMILAA